MVTIKTFCKTGCLSTCGSVWRNLTTLTVTYNPLTMFIKWNDTNTYEYFFYYHWTQTQHSESIFLSSSDENSNPSNNRWNPNQLNIVWIIVFTWRWKQALLKCFEHLCSVIMGKVLAHIGDISLAILNKNFYFPCCLREIFIT